MPAPLTVVCEGRASATRDALGVRFEVTRYPQHAIAARLEAEQPHDGIARQWFNDKGEVLALLPLGGAQRQLGGAGVVGRPAARAATCWRRTPTNSTPRCTTPATTRSAR